MAAIQRDCLRIFINTSKLISIVVLSSLVVLSGCNHKTRAASKTISASTDASGSHPGSADIPGPVMVTCVSAHGRHRNRHSSGVCNQCAGDKRSS